MNKTNAIVTESYINPITNVIYAHRIVIDSYSSVYAEDELQKLLKDERYNVINNPVEVKQMPQGGTYLANKISDGDDFVSVLTGNLLDRHIKHELREIKGKRDIFNDLYKRVVGKSDRKVVLLHGIRRTGKTILLLQLLQELTESAEADYNQIALVTVNNSIVTLRDISNILHELEQKGFKYVFIDEVTKINDIVKNSQFIHDAYPRLQVLMTGTSSLAISMLSMRSLATRSRYFTMGPVTYSEYCKLRQPISFLDYIRYGGIFTDEFKEFETMKGYVYTSIIENIIDTLVKNNLDVDFGISRDNISTIVSKVLYNHLTDTSVDIVNKTFNLKFTAGRKVSKGELKLLVSELNESINITTNSNITDRQFEQVLRMLKDMGVIDEIINLYGGGRNSITRYPGLVYIFSEYFMREDALKKVLGVSQDDAEEMAGKHREVLEGFLIENTIVAEMQARYHKNKIVDANTLNINNILEVDLVVSKYDPVECTLDGKPLAFGEEIYNDYDDDEEDQIKTKFIDSNSFINFIEIKRHDKTTPKQARWLLDKSLHIYSDGVTNVNRIILYLGKTKIVSVSNSMIRYKQSCHDDDFNFKFNRGMDTITGGYDANVQEILYLNIEEFMLDPEKFTLPGVDVSKGWNKEMPELRWIG